MRRRAASASRSTEDDKVAFFRDVSASVAIIPNSEEEPDAMTGTTTSKVVPG